MKPAQCRAARGLLAWSQDELARQSGVSLRTIISFEIGERQPRQGTVMKLKAAFGAASVTLIETNGGGPGVRLTNNSE